MLERASEVAVELFQSTPSGGKATSFAVSQIITYSVSIHAFRGEGDRSFLSLMSTGNRFQSTPSGGKATRRTGVTTPYRNVSIHAFRGEGDVPTSAMIRCSYGFNPRLPGGRRPTGANVSHTVLTFQSTPSGGKATNERLLSLYLHSVSIHAFRGEGDVRRIEERVVVGRFNPRLPGGRRPRGSTGSG